jgi:hypothetical protein
MSLYTYLLLTAHISTDLVFQPSWIALNKKKLNYPMLAHIVISTLAIQLVLIFCLPIKQILLASFIWMISHLFLDISKEEMTDRRPSWYWPLFGLDQLGHITTIFILSRLFNI